MSASSIIKRFQLLPHPEGGYFKETYRCKADLVTDHGPRNISTAIYFLLEEKNKSNFHRIKSDELWFFHQGNAVEIYILSENGLQTVVLGNDITNNEVPQATIPANTWFAAKVKDEKGYTFVSCTVAPGFDFRDFEMAEREILVQKYPSHQALIHSFTTDPDL